MGLTPLYHAAAGGNLENVQLLLDAGADVNPLHRSFGSPLCIAALRGLAEIVDVLLNHKASLVASRGGRLGTAMHCAFFNGNISVVKYLLAAEYGLDPDLTSHRTYSNVSLTLLTELGKSHRTNAELKPLLSHRDEEGRIHCLPILLAVDRCHFDLLQLCWLGTQDDVPATTPNHTMEEDRKDCSGNSSGLNQGLVDEAKGQGTNVIPKLYTPDETWCFDHEQEVPTRTPAQGRAQTSAEPSYSSVQSRSGPSYASKASTSSAWSCLGFPLPEKSTGPSSTLIMWAAGLLKIDVIEHLLEAGALINTQNTAGKTALHYAMEPFLLAEYEAAETCVRRLVESGASSLFVLDKRLRTPLDCAINRYGAFDPRILRKWDPSSQTACIGVLLDNISNQREWRAYDALFRLLRTGSCPQEVIAIVGERCATRYNYGKSFELLWEAMQHDATRMVMNMWLPGVRLPNYFDWPTVRHHDSEESALHHAISFHAPVAIITLLLDYRANSTNPVDRFTLEQLASLATREGRKDLAGLLSPTNDTPLPPEPAPSTTPQISRQTWLEGAFAGLFRARSTSS